MDPMIGSMVIAFITLALLESVLGIDNIVFATIMAQQLPPEKQALARRLGIIMAVVFRIGLLFVISYIAAMTTPIAFLADYGITISWRNLILIVGGIFLLVKATWEIHERFDFDEDEDDEDEDDQPSFWAVIAQIVVMDAIFSLDSVITAVGLVQNIGIMIAALLFATVIMVFASDRISRFVSSKPSVIMLCLNFLVLIGFSLVVEGFGIHVPKEYIYIAMAGMITQEGVMLFWKKKKVSSMQKITRIRRKAKAYIP